MMKTKFFNSIIILRFGKTKVAKEEFYGAKKVAKEEFYGAKKPIKIWNVNIDNIVISKLIETKNNSSI